MSFIGVQSKRGRGRPPGKADKAPRRAYQISRMWSKHHDIKRYVLLGLRNKEIAHIMGCSAQNICDIRNSEMFKREVHIIECCKDYAAIDVSQMLEEGQAKNLTTLIDIRDGDDSPLSLKAKIAMDLLDRSPKTSKVRRIEGTLLTGELGPEEIEDIKNKVQRAKKLAASNGDIVDAQFEEVKDAKIV